MAMRVLPDPAGVAKRCRMCFCSSSVMDLSSSSLVVAQVFVSVWRAKTNPGFFNGQYSNGSNVVGARMWWTTSCCSGVRMDGQMDVGGKKEADGAKIVCQGRLSGQQAVPSGMVGMVWTARVVGA